MLRLYAAILAVASLTWSPSVQAQSQVQPDDRVVRNVVVRSGPGTDTAPIDALDPGETLELIGEVPSWYRVALPDGRQGFVSKAWTVPIDGPAAAHRVHVIDVGTGLAIFVEGPDFTMLYDAGSQDDTRRGRRNRVVNYLRKVRPDLSRIDHLVLSHAHKDHLSLLNDIFDFYAVGTVWDSGRLYDSCGYRTFLTRIAAEPGVSYRTGIGANQNHVFHFAQCQSPPHDVSVELGPELTVGPVPLGTGATLRFLHLDTAPHPDPNENSLVVLLSLGGGSILLMGDAEAGQRRDPSLPPDPGSIEALLLACCRSQLRADVLISGHHGSKTSSRAVFLDAVGASTYVISSGPYLYSGTGLPDAEVVAEYERRGTLYRTDLDDPACRTNPAKIGPDGDGKVGGCDNILIEVAPGAGPRARYHRIAD